MNFFRSARVLSHDYDRLLTEVEEEQEVFETSPAVRRGPAGDSPLQVCDGDSPRQSPCRGRPTSELLRDAAMLVAFANRGQGALVTELRERAMLLEGMGD